MKKNKKIKINKRQFHLGRKAMTNLNSILKSRDITLPTKVHKAKAIFCPFIFISWRPITLQYCSGFCHTLTWISHGVTCIPHPDPPSHFPLYPYILPLYCVLTQSNSLWPHSLKPFSLLCPRSLLGKNTGVGCHILLPRGRTQSPALQTDSLLSEPRVLSDSLWSYGP